MVPAGIHVIFTLYSSLSESKVSFFDGRERPENILFDHLNDLIQIRDN